MPEYYVSLNEIVSRTYKVDAGSMEEAVIVAKSLADPEDHLVDEDEFIDYWGDVNVEEDVRAVPVIRSPSGWSFRESQENGDEVSCQGCGNQLNDDFPIVNDDEGYAYHEGCLAPSN